MKHQPDIVLTLFSMEGGGGEKLYQNAYNFEVPINQSRSVLLFTPF